jgi:phosphate acyltransferase
MGGDKAPAVVVDGAVQALAAAPGKLAVILVGAEDVLRRELDRYDLADLNLHVVNAPEVIGMDEAPAVAVKTKRQSSIHIGLGAHKEGRADAFVSAGNTGAVMAASLFILGRLPGVLRPTVPGFFPTTESFTVVLDVGANVDSKPEHLVQFAQMGKIYVEKVLHRENPAVALLNIGEEPGKGNEAVKMAYEILQQMPGLRFVGNIEGRDVMNHAADVIVCDGFTGNIMLKFGESVVAVLPKLLGAEMQAQRLGREDVETIQRVLAGVVRRFNYEEFGGSPLLGVDGNVLIAHGSSSARAIEQAILRAAEVVEQGVTASIADSFGA